jgi:hypothetical protein
MGARKPRLGHRSRTAAILALRAEGVDDHTIAVRLGIAVKTVRSLVNHHAAGTAPGRRDASSAMEAQLTQRGPTSAPAVREIVLRVPEALYARFIEMARREGRTPGAYALELFTAAYGARVAPTGDTAPDSAGLPHGRPA